jgi:SAM-dependent methyltransferase
LKPIPDAVTELVAGNDVADDDFDQALFPLRFNGNVSKQHWTPLVVARRAVALLASKRDETVLDIGAGVGKFCLVGSLTTNSTFVGIEQRLPLVHSAREAADRCRARRAYFLHGNALDLGFSDFDAFYLFNPFYEHMDPTLEPIDDTLETSPRIFAQYVIETTVKLGCLRRGTRVVTYNGLGGRLPETYDCIFKERCLGNTLALWIKQ